MRPDPRIRPANPADSAAIAAIWNPIIRDTLVTFNAAERPAAEIAALIASARDNGRAFLVAEESGLLGFVTYSQFRNGVGYRHSMEHTIILAPEARGRGVGRALMTAAEAHAASGGAHVMVAGISAENPAARAFHAAIGYREVAVVPEVGHKFDRWLDLVLMIKRL
jgi:phosphinothricin acetyltransferase